MKMVGEIALSKEVEVKQAAFECLVSITSTYYDVLEAYMPGLFELTSNAVKGDVKPVVLQVIKFWSSVCNKEIELQENEDNVVGDCGHPHSRFIEKYLTRLVPMLLETLLKLEDVGKDESIWNISKAGGTCLGLVARTVCDPILPLVMPFVEANIVKPDWRCQEAATKAPNNVLKFAKTNFQNEQERNHIMQMVYGTASSMEVEVKLVAFECLVSIASTYYDLLEDYMPDLFEKEKLLHFQPVKILLHSFCYGRHDVGFCGIGIRVAESKLWVYCLINSSNKWSDRMSNHAS